MKVYYCIKCENPVPCTCVTKDEQEVIVIDATTPKQKDSKVNLNPGKKKR